MSLIKSFRPAGLKVTLDDDSVLELMIIRKNPRNGIVARVRGQQRIILWDNEDSAEHMNDTEEQFVTKLKEVLA